MACPEIRLEGIDAGRYGELLKRALEQGLELVGTSGRTHFQGMEFSWAYDEAAAVLVIQCLEKPIFVPCGMIEGRIRGLVG